MTTKSRIALNGAATATATTAPVLPLVSPGCQNVPAHFTVRVLPVSPSVAREWLEKVHPNNRPASRTRIRAYAADMKAGRWYLSDQPITFDEEDFVVNGRHRLEAIVLSGVVVNFIVVRGIAKGAMLVLDSGKRRTTDEQLKIAGHSWPRGAGATVRRIWQSVEYRTPRALTDSEVEGWLLNNGDSVVFAHKHLAKGRMALAPIRAVIARAFLSGKSKARLEKFAQVLTTGLMVPGDEAAIYLRNRILEDTTPGRGAYARKVLYGLTEAALELFLSEEKPAKHLYPTKVELFPLKGEKEWFQD